jgi:hypothetical protein
MNALRNTANALALMVFLFSAWAIVEGQPSDIEAIADTAMAHDDAVTEARLAAMSLGENERIAWRVCKGLHGEKAVVLQLRDSGEFVCRRAGVVL